MFCVCAVHLYYVYLNVYMPLLYSKCIFKIKMFFDSRVQSSSPPPAGPPRYCSRFALHIWRLQL